MNDNERRELNKKIVQEVMDGLYEWAEAGKPLDHWRKYYSDDFVLEMPQFGSRVEGLEGMLGAVSTVPKNFANWRQSDYIWHDCVDPDDMIWEADADAVFRHSGKSYDQHYVIFARMRDGKIVHYREFVNMEALNGFPPQDGLSP
jgi:ketosteroid isomerase-like protein